MTGGGTRLAVAQLAGFVFPSGVIAMSPSRILWVALLVAAPVRVRAEVATVPPVPPLSLGDGYFGQLGGISAFAGCASGPVGAGLVGTPYCVNGLFAVGLEYPSGLRPPISFVNGAMAMNVSAAPGLGSVFATAADVQTLTGTRGSPTGGVEPYVATLASVLGAPGQQSWRDDLYLPYAPANFAPFVPRQIVVRMRYATPGGAGAYPTLGATLDATVAVTAPEPSTVALVAVGAAGLAAGAARRQARPARR